MGPHVGQPSGQGRGGEHVGAGVEVEPQPSRLRVQRHEAGAVGRAHVEHAVAHGGRADHPRLARRVVPSLASGGGVDRVHVRIAASRVHRAVHDRGGGLEADLVVDDRVLARLERPLLLSRVRVEGVEITVPAADEDGVVVDGGGGVHDVPGGEFPVEHAALGVDRVDVSVAAAEEHLATDNGRRRGEHVPGVGDGLSRGQEPVEILRLELPLEFRGEDPFHGTGRAVQGDQGARR